MVLFDSNGQFQLFILQNGNFIIINNLRERQMRLNAWTKDIQALPFFITKEKLEMETGWKKLGRVATGQTWIFTLNPTQ